MTEREFEWCQASLRIPRPDRGDTGAVRCPFGCVDAVRDISRRPRPRQRRNRQDASRTKHRKLTCARDIEQFHTGEAERA